MKFLKRHVLGRGPVKIKHRVFTRGIKRNKSISAGQRIVLCNARIKTAGRAGIAWKVQVAVDNLRGLTNLLCLAVLPTKDSLKVIAGLEHKACSENIVLSGTCITSHIIFQPPVTTIQRLCGQAPPDGFAQ